MEYKNYKMNNLNIYTIKTDKFKGCRIDVVFRNKVIKEEISIREVLFDLLLDSNKDYNTKRKLLIKLEELYNAGVGTSTRKLGNSFLTTVSLSFLNPKYTNEKVLEDTIKLFLDLILKPDVLNNQFNFKTLNIIKNINVEEIDSIKENSFLYSCTNALKTLGESPSSYLNYGNVSDILKITPSSLYKYYQKVLKEDEISIYVAGNLDMDEMVKLISKYANFKTNKLDIDLNIKNKKMKTIIKKEDYIYSQTNIVMILHLDNLSIREKLYVAGVYDTILGNGSLETKLYRKLREENSLCYNLLSSYLKYDGLIIIHTAVDKDKEDKAIELIKETLKEMENNITDDEINKAKENIITTLNMSDNNLSEIIYKNILKNIDNLEPKEKLIKEYKSVTKEEIYKLSKKITLISVYSLIGGLNDKTRN